MSINTLLVAVAGLGLSGLAVAQDGNKRASEVLRGTWTVVASIDADGKREPVAEDDPTHFTFEFTADKLITRLKSRSLEGGYQLDATRSPKQIDVVGERNGKELTFQGIYAIEGDRLEVCLAGPGNGRPTEFRLGDGIEFAVQLTRTELNAPTLASANRTIDAQRGARAEAFTIESAILNQTRNVGIALPASFATSAPDRRYPVLVVVDGEWMLTKVAVVGDELSRNGLIPEAILVAIENIDEFDGRVFDLTPPGLSVSGSNRNQGGDRFVDFIEQELLPAIDRQFRGAAPRTFIGTSSGGVLATWIAATRPSFRNVIALDAPIQLENCWLAKQLIARASTGGEPLRYVSYEARLGWPDDEWKALVAAAPEPWQLHREKMPLEGHETMQMVGAYLSLREVFRDYSCLAAPQFPTTSILPYYSKVDVALGAPLVPPKRVIRDVVENLLMEGRGAEARLAWNRLIFGYGAPDDSSALLAQIADVERRPPPTETVEALLAVAFPTPEEARAYIGEWAGETRHTADAPPAKQTLRIRIENGRVVGETYRVDAPAEYAVRHWEHLRITKDGIAWGYMNGMRPRGVILHEAKRDGDTITGSMRFGGINFVRPDGRTGPLETFTFRKLR